MGGLDLTEIAKRHGGSGIFEHSTVKRMEATPKQKAILERERAHREKAADQGILQTSANPPAPPLADPRSRVPTGSVENFTDVSNARRLVSRHGPDLRFCGAWGWSVWDGARWKRDDDGEPIRRAKETADSFFKEASALLAAAPSGDAGKADREHAQKLLEHGLKSEGEKRIVAMLNLAESELPVVAAPKVFDRDPLLLNVANGILDLRDGRLRPHAREELLTKMAPVAWDENAKAPRWEKFIDRIAGGDAALVTYLQRAIGYSLTGDVSEQCLFFCYGRGKNGKSTLIETVRALLGDYARTTRFAMFLAKNQDSGATPELVALQGARFVTASEVGAGRRMDEEMIKQITGGDEVTGRGLYRDEVSFHPVLKLWWSANNKPRPRGKGDEGLWRRMKTIPFNVTIPEEERDKHLGDRMRAEELPGILTWAAAGCIDWQRDGLAEPAAVVEATKEYREEMDVVASFIADVCIKAADARVPSTELHHQHVAWCKANGEPEISQRHLAILLKDAGFKTVKSCGVNVWSGLGILEKSATTSSQGALPLRGAREQ